MNIINALNNRELAIAIWSLIALLGALLVNDFRRAIPGLLKAFFTPKLFIPIVIMLFYVFLVVFLLEKIGFWDVSALKDTILWTTGSAFATYFSLNKATDKNYFKSIIFDNIKLILVFEFIVNLYSFNLIAELIIVPITTVIVLLGVVAELKPEHKKVKVFLDYILGLFGLVVIIYTVREVIGDFGNFASIKNLRDFLLPPLLTASLLPFIYFMAVYIQYDSLFTRVDFTNNKSEMAKYAKRKIFSACHINLSKIIKLSKNAGLPKINGKDDVTALIRKAQEN